MQFLLYAFLQDDKAIKTTKMSAECGTDSTIYMFCSLDDQVGSGDESKDGDIALTLDTVDRIVRSVLDGEDDDGSDEGDDDVSIYDQPEQEQGDDENTTESRTDQNEHEKDCLDIPLFKLACLKQFESPKRPFDVLTCGLLALNRTLSEAYWFQLSLKKGRYMAVGTFHDLVGLGKKECLDDFIASGLVLPNKNGRLEAKKKMFEIIMCLLHQNRQGPPNWQRRTPHFCFARRERKDTVAELPVQIATDELLALIKECQYANDGEVVDVRITKERDRITGTGRKFVLGTHQSEEGSLF
jgi:hypothetical protein